MTPTVAGALAEARRRGVDRLDVQLLLSALLGRPRAWLIAHDDTPLDAAQVARLQAAFDARLDGVPLAYLTGEQVFCGLTLAVGPGVLVPRPETEGLVEWVRSCLHDRADAAVADLGTGSGAIALAIKATCPAARVTAVERSPQALAIARDNGRRLQLDVDWRHGDWWQPLVGQQFDVVVANPPYVADGDPHLVALHHEPASALVAGADGLDDLRDIVATAPAHLRPGGWLLLEHGHDQGAATRGLLAAAGFVCVCTRPDLAGLDRCSGGQMPELGVETA
ncbi:peptide chain release factor N(5)-glutamine methyltransferase [Rubrivivax albus]|uniref:Release factor glutamine methyltransferase n=1 Tax=Rubrivivax albus TaxID=2499835 RepID=A0A3S2TN67_9BURK|nr:peptide chain release factor N(5)-glutamine methyltransferase [Rubrivivax albus]RVT52137.1 peptide chain release factor N(5)-glutamine methyltransferase [Rubrivivax albus]